MIIKYTIKKLVKSIIYNRILNALLRLLIKPISSIIPNKIRNRIPIVGTSRYKLPNGKELYLYTDGYHDIIATKIYWEGINAYESNTVRLFIKLLQHTETVFDIGANTGLYALIAAIYEPNRKVYAFEPVPENFDYLKRNVIANKLNNLYVCSSAVMDFNGETTLYIPNDFIPVSASTLKGFRNASEAISVRAVTLESYVILNNISRVGLIKIDTEATEHLALKGAKLILKRDEPTIICEVLAGRTEKDLHYVLNDLGYKYFQISDDGIIQKKRIEGDTTYKNTNYMFITEKRLRRIIDVIGIR